MASPFGAEASRIGIKLSPDTRSEYNEYPYYLSGLKMRSLDVARRIFGTGLSFALFGIGGVLLSLSLFPLLRLFSPDAAVARRRIQRAMQLMFALFIGTMKTLGVITYELHGIEKLRRPGQLIVSNHPSLIDVVFLVSLLPQVDCIVKVGLWRNPFLRWPVAWAGYIPNTHGEELVERCAATLRRGNSLLVFPEGTRTTPGAGISIKRGAAQIALASRADILPVTIRCVPPMLGKHVPWYRVPERAGHFTITVGEPVPASDYCLPGEPQSVAARRLTRWLRACYSTEESRRAALGSASADDALGAKV